MYELALLNAAEYSKRQIHALAAAVKERMATREQAELVKLYWRTRDLRNRLEGLRLKKRMRAFIAQRAALRADPTPPAPPSSP